MREWPGRVHVEKLRAWPELATAAQRIEERPQVFSGAILLGSLARGEGDAISDIDLVAVTQPRRWQRAWETRHFLSAGALVTFDGFEEGKVEIAKHTWLTQSLVRVECMITAPARMRLRGSAVVIVGRDDLLEGFEKAAPRTRKEIEEYAANRRDTNTMSEIERAYGALIELLRCETRPSNDA